MFHRLSFVWTIFSLFFFTPVTGQVVKGLPLVKNYSPQEYVSHRQNWDITQAPDQVMYIANGKGVLQYDGETWRLIMVPNKGHVRSIVTTPDGVVCVGAHNDFGILRPDKQGVLQFESWLEKLTVDQREFGRVYTTIATDNAIYWQTHHTLFRWQNGVFKVWEFPTTVRRLFYWQNTIYLADENRGLCYLNEQDSIVTAPGGEFLAGSRTDFLVPRGKNALLGSRNHGLVIYDGTSFTPFPLNPGVIGEGEWLERAVYLPDGRLVLTHNLNKGVIILDQNAQVVDHINTQTGLNNNDVLAIFLDSRNGLWLAMQEGLARVEVMAPFSIYDERLGLDGTIQDLEIFRGDLYIGTNKGLGRLEVDHQGSRFVEIPGIVGYSWSLLSWKDHILTGTTFGTYSFDGTTVKNIGDLGFTSKVVPSKADSNLVFFVSDIGFMLYRFQNNQWEEMGRMEGIEGSVRDLIELDLGQCWLKTRSQGLVRVYLPFDKQSGYTFENAVARYYQADQGVPAGENNIFLVDGMLLLRSENDQAFRYDQGRDIFIPYPEMAEHFALNPGIVLPKQNEGPGGTIWLDYFGNEGHYLVKAQKQLNGQFTTNRYPLNELIESFQDIFSNEIFHADEQFVWYAGMNGMIRYAYSENPKKRAHFPVYIKQVWAKDSLRFQQYTDSMQTLSFPYAQNDLTFAFSTPLYQEEPYRQYQFQLEGFDPDWSGWTSVAQKQYTNLSEGDYRFRVRARDSYGNIQEAQPITILISPPWYRSIMAYLIYFLMGIGLLSGIIHFRSRQLRLQNQQLEALVNQRTETIRTQAEELKELNQVKSRFFANISHELRTPLTLILSPIEDLLQETKSTNERGRLQLIHNNAQRLLRLINQLLDLAKLDDNKLELRASQGNIVRFCRQLVGSFQSLADQKDLLLEFKVTEEEIYVYYDEQKLEQILLNLISNAFKFTSEKGKVCVELSRIDYGHEGALQIVVADSGIGITAEQLPYVFDRFYQADNEDTRFFPGTGIGLSLTKELVELHGGTIGVESEKDRGARFIVTLPLGKSHLSKDQIWTVQVDKERTFPEQKDDIPLALFTEETTPREEKPLLLVVDDHDELRQYIVHQLQNQYQVMDANNGLDAWEMALRHTPDLIISDVMMPGMSGYQLCDKLKGDIRTNHIPLVLLTAKAGVNEKLKGLTHQADAYLTKPFNTKELLLTTQNLIILRNRLRQRYAGQILFDSQESPATSQEEVFLKQLADLVEQHLEDTTFGVDQMSDQLGMSRSQLNRKMRALLDKSPNQYIRSYRLARARQLIEKNAATIAEIAFDTGFSSAAYFSKCFLDEYGYSPTEWRDKSHPD
ncbi:MAG: hypothetical protein DHS20C18_54280 [Saprospiraceae bacterium]|nr:MAG: hypothetical protein DHS20C18_54280 [Saprospiraceae bacterium]